MPSFMIHLLTAHKLKEDRDPLFCIGTVSPDAVGAREEKDITHFRTLENRQDALYDLALRTKKEDRFGQGVLLHLYVDWQWDYMAFKSYCDTHHEECWFSDYRNEIAKAGSYIHHNYDWTQQVWEIINSCDPASYGHTPGADITDVQVFLKRNYKWHTENNIGPSVAYPPEYVENFTDIAVKSYKEWLNKSRLLI